MHPDVLYLQREFCGLEKGAEFKLRQSHSSDMAAHVYQHTDSEGGVFAVPADAAAGDPVWFAALAPGDMPGGDEDDEEGTPDDPEELAI